MITSSPDCAFREILTPYPTRRNYRKVRISVIYIWFSSVFVVVSVKSIAAFVLFKKTIKRSRRLCKCRALSSSSSSFTLCSLSLSPSDTLLISIRLPLLTKYSGSHPPEYCVCVWSFPRHSPNHHIFSLPFKIHYISWISAQPSEYGVAFAFGNV